MNKTRGCFLVATSLWAPGTAQVISVHRVLKGAERVVTGQPHHLILEDLKRVAQVGDVVRFKGRVITELLQGGADARDHRAQE